MQRKSALLAHTSYRHYSGDESVGFPEYKTPGCSSQKMKDWDRFFRCSFNKRVKDRPYLRYYIELRQMHIMVKTVQFVGTL